MRFAACLLFLMALGCSIEMGQKERIANELCECVRPLQNSLSNTTIDLVFKASLSDSPRQVLTQALNKLNNGEKKRVGAELSRYRELADPNSTVGLCIRNVKKQSRVIFVLEQKNFVEDVIDQLEKKNCTLAAALLRSDRNTGTVRTRD